MVSQINSVEISFKTQFPLCFGIKDKTAPGFENDSLANILVQNLNNWRYFLASMPSFHFIFLFSLIRSIFQHRVGKIISS